MPPKIKFTREEILNAAFAIAKDSGIGAITVRGIASKLKCSTCPIFTAFNNIDEVKVCVVKMANELYLSYLCSDDLVKKYPKYKAIGMGYIKFAKQEPQLFKMLFMCDKDSNFAKKDDSEFKEICYAISKNLSISIEQAKLFHLENWVLVHGIAVMVSTGYYIWTDEMISQVVSDVYLGLVERIRSKK